MLTLSNHSGQVTGGRALFRKRIWLRILVLIGLGTMVLMVTALLSGCGSDSTPGGAVKGKNAKTATIPRAKKSQVPTLLGMEEERGSGAGEMVDVKKQPDRKTVELPDITREEMEAKNAAAVKIAESPGMKVMPGITREEMVKRNAEAVKIAESPGMEVMPGVTKEELVRRNAEAVKKMPPQSVEKMSEGSKQVAAQPPAKPPLIPEKREISPPSAGK